MITLEHLQDRLHNAPTGTVYHIIVRDGGVQDGLDYGPIAVEVVVLDSIDVAFRYTSDAQDGDWEIDNLETAHEEAVGWAKAWEDEDA